MQERKWVSTSTTSVPVSATEAHAVVQSHSLYSESEKVRTQRELQNTFFTKWVPTTAGSLNSSESRNKEVGSSRLSSALAHAK